MSDWTIVATPVVDLAIKLSDLTTTTSLTRNYQGVLADATGGSFTLTLPAVSTHQFWVYIIKKVDSTANSVRIEGNGSEQIEWEDYIELKARGDYVWLIPDDTRWYVVGGGYMKMETTLEEMLEEERDTVKLLQRQILLLGVIERHISDERGEEVDKDEVQEQLDDEFSDNIDDEVE